MKTLLKLFLFFLVSNISFGQKKPPILWNASPKDFVDNKVTQVSAYLYVADKKGEIPKKGFLSHQQTFDATQNKIFGFSRGQTMGLHGVVYQFFDKFETFYNSEGKIIKEITQPQDFGRKDEYGKITYTITNNETIYQYDSLKRKISETKRELSNDYSIDKKTKDTSVSRAIVCPATYEYFYNSDGKTIKAYHRVDSTQYIGYDGTSEKTCLYCHSKYLAAEHKYNLNKNRIETISYTSENLIHTKSFYFYDEQRRLIKEIDSTGWYLQTVEPYWDITTTYEYSDTGKIITEICNPKRGIIRHISYFNKENQLIKKCNYSYKRDDCTEYLYIYKDGKLIKEITFSSNFHDTKEYSYNKKGLLKEQRLLWNGRLIELIKYRYK